MVATLAGTPAALAVKDSNGPIAMPGAQIDNFGVVDGRIYRGEQPKKDDFLALKEIGVTTVVDLRLDAKKDSRKLAEAAGLKYVNIGIDGHGQPTDADVARFISLLDTNPSEKFYVHCAGGRHRTGSMIAIYRMVRNGWDIERAYGEMLAYDFYTRNGHKGFKTYVYDYSARLQQDPASVPVSPMAPAPAAVVDAANGVAAN